jgi:hypothetical protein
MIKDFKFLSEEDESNQYPSHYSINQAIQIGRESYLNGASIDYNPFLTPELAEAFEQGWELEEGYEILRQAQQRANDGF